MIIVGLTANVLLVNLILAVVLPNLVALVTAKVSSNALKSIILLALAAISGVLTQIVSSSGNFHWKAAVLSFATIFIGSVAAHFGLLKPTGITGTAGVIQTSVPGGLGSSTGGPQPLSNGSPQ